MEHGLGKKKKKKEKKKRKKKENHPVEVPGGALEWSTHSLVSREDMFSIRWETSRETQSSPHTILCTGVLQLTTEEQIFFSERKSEKVPERDSNLSLGPQL